MIKLEKSTKNLKVRAPDGGPGCADRGGGLPKFSKPGLFLADPPFGHV